jgi:hypothetical protein
MAIKLNPAKAQFFIVLLKSNSNRFTPAQLLSATGNERRARSALSHARMAGVVLEAIRDSGRAVTAYVANGSLPAIAASSAKASRAPSAKSAKTARVAAPKVKAAPAVKTKRVAKAKAAPAAATVKSDEEVAAIKAKNLETMREVSQRIAKLEDRLTPEQRAIREEFYAEEEAIARMEEQAALRANAPAFLFKESYSE